jgi:alpha/beta superfamily hydrolase
VCLQEGRSTISCTGAKSARCHDQGFYNGNWQRLHAWRKDARTAELHVIPTLCEYTLLTLAINHPLFRLPGDFPLNAQTEHCFLNGLAGRIEALHDRAVPRSDGMVRGTAIVAHPHPLFAGTMNNKVVQTLARALAQDGWDTWRFNFRGVGQSEGVHDHGIGEAQDLLHVIEQVAPTGTLALAGFSFGTFVIGQAVQTLHPQRDIASLLYVGTAASRFAIPAIPEELHPRTLVIHGEDDDTVPLTCVQDWARPQTLPVLVVPQTEHFFHGRQILLKTLAARHLRSI